MTASEHVPAPRAAGSGSEHTRGRRLTTAALVGALPLLWLATVFMPTSFREVFAAMPEGARGITLLWVVVLTVVLAIGARALPDRTHSRMWFTQRFGACGTVLSVAFVFLFVAKEVAVVRIPVASGGVAVFPVGFGDRPDSCFCNRDSRCENGPFLGSAECIEKCLTLSDAAVEACWGQGRVATTRGILLLAYIIMTAAAAGLVRIELLRRDVIHHAELRATPWFEDRPLDFNREETRLAEALLVLLYPSDTDALRLAAEAGLDPAFLRDAATAHQRWRWLLERAQEGGKLMRLLAEIIGDGHDDDRREQLLALIAGHEAALQVAMLEHLPTLSKLAALPPSVELRRPGERAQPLADRGVFEKTINAAAGFTDVGAFLRGLATAEVRTARIVVGGHAKGTGFLVGKSLLLTNWHVVSNGGAAVAQFDHKVATTGAVLSEGRKVAFAPDWDVAHSVHAEAAVELSADGPSPGTWDYALVRLAEPVGDEAVGAEPRAGDKRDAYVLDGAEYTFLEGEPVLIVGHPEGRPMQLSYAAPSQARRTKSATRVRYATNTEGGSSGSPVFNKEWRLVALHHASGPTNTPGALDMRDAVFNQGIPIRDIVADLKKQLEDRSEVLAELGLR